MSRTYRRRSERHEYPWVLRDYRFESGYLERIELDPKSPEGRRAIARFHSDAHLTILRGAPRWFRRLFKRRQRNENTKQLLKWFVDSGYEPMMNARHRHSAQWEWW